MSRASKITLAITSALSVITVFGVHYIQDAEKAVSTYCLLLLYSHILQIKANFSNF